MRNICRGFFFRVVRPGVDPVEGALGPAPIAVQVDDAVATSAAVQGLHAALRVLRSEEVVAVITYRT